MIQQVFYSSFTKFLYQSWQRRPFNVCSLKLTLHTKTYLFRSLRNSLLVNTLLISYFTKMQYRLLYGISSPNSKMILLPKSKLWNSYIAIPFHFKSFVFGTKVTTYTVTRDIYMLEF